MSYRDRRCRWCGKWYEPGKVVDRDGFCCPAHKAALYRAYKKYVTECYIEGKNDIKDRLRKGEKGQKKEVDAETEALQ